MTKTISEQVRARHQEVVAEINRIRERSKERVEDKIQSLQQKGDHLDKNLGKRLLHTLGEVFEIAPAQERWNVYQNFRDGHYLSVISDLNRYSQLVENPDQVANLKELSSMIGMKYICPQEYFSLNTTTSK